MARLNGKIFYPMSFRWASHENPSYHNSDFNLFYVLHFELSLQMKLVKVSGNNADSSKQKFKANLD